MQVQLWKRDLEQMFFEMLGTAHRQNEPETDWGRLCAGAMRNGEQASRRLINKSFENTGHGAEGAEGI